MKRYEEVAGVFLIVAYCAIYRAYMVGRFFLYIVAGRITGARGAFLGNFQKLRLKVLDKQNIRAYNKGMLSKSKHEN